jgi:hypothetical protein
MGAVVGYRGVINATRLPGLTRFALGQFGRGVATELKNDYRLGPNLDS